MHEKCKGCLLPPLPDRERSGPMFSTPPITSRQFFASVPVLKRTLKVPEQKLATPVSVEPRCQSDRANTVRPSAHTFLGYRPYREAVDRVRSERQTQTADSRRGAAEFCTSRRKLIQEKWNQNADNSCRDARWAVLDIHTSCFGAEFGRYSAADSSRTVQRKNRQDVCGFQAGLPPTGSVAGGRTQCGIDPYR